MNCEQNWTVDKYNKNYCSSCGDNCIEEYYSQSEIDALQEELKNNIKIITSSNNQKNIKNISDNDLSIINNTLKSFSLVIDSVFSKYGLSDEDREAIDSATSRQFDSAKPNNDLCKCGHTKTLHYFNKGKDKISCHYWNMSGNNQCKCNKFHTQDLDSSNSNIEAGNLQILSSKSPSQEAQGSEDSFKSKQQSSKPNQEIYISRNDL